MIEHFRKYWIEDLPTFLTLIPLVVLWYRLDYKKKVERYFFIYLCSKFGIEIVMFFMAVEGQNNLFLYNTFVLVSYCLLAKMSFEAIDHRVARRIIYAGSAIFLLGFCYDIVDVGMYEVVKISGTVQCLLLIAYCGMFFAWLSHTIRIPNLLEYPPFWIFSGVLSYYAATTFATPIFNICERFGAKGDLYVVVLASYVAESIYLTVVGFGLMVEK